MRELLRLFSREESNPDLLCPAILITWRQHPRGSCPAAWTSPPSRAGPSPRWTRPRRWVPSAAPAASPPFAQPIPPCRRIFFERKTKSRRGGGGGGGGTTRWWESSSKLRLVIGENCTFGGRIFKCALTKPSLLAVLNHLFIISIYVYGQVINLHF